MLVALLFMSSFAIVRRTKKLSCCAWSSLWLNNWWINRFVAKVKHTTHTSDPADTPITGIMSRKCNKKQITCNRSICLIELSQLAFMVQIRNSFCNNSFCILHLTIGLFSSGTLRKVGKGSKLLLCWGKKKKNHSIWRNSEHNVI